MLFQASLLLTIFVLLLAIDAVAVDDDVKLANAIVDWVRQKGGFFSDKLEIRRMDPKDPSSPLGVFASLNIEPHEPLVNVPHSCFIGIWKDTDKEGGDYGVCRLSKKLAKELELGNESDYAPYIQYVKAQKEGQIPAMWSEAGKEVLRKVLTPGSDGVDWVERPYFKNCDVDNHVLAVTIQRGYDTALIPLWDMFNHWNGHVNVEHGGMYENDGLKARATTNIQKGEEVYATYNECVDCGQTWWYWGTPEILRDFGFVEAPRQRWIFGEQDIWFEIDVNEDSGELQVEWYKEDDYYERPDEEGLAFLKEELTRLQQVTLAEKPKEVPVHEWNTIVQFHKAATVAVSLATESAMSLFKEDDEL